MMRLAIDPDEMVQNDLISSKPKKRIRETNIWYKNLVFCSLVFSLFLLPTPLLQPQYKSAQKTVWALAVVAVNFE